MTSYPRAALGLSLGILNHPPFLLKYQNLDLPVLQILGSFSCVSVPGRQEVVVEGAVVVEVRLHGAFIAKGKGKLIFSIEEEASRRAITVPFHRPFQWSCIRYQKGDFMACAVPEAPLQGDQSAVYCHHEAKI